MVWSSLHSANCSKQYLGQTIYEWEQTIDEVSVFVTPPPGIKAKMIDCRITPNKLTLGIKGNDRYYLDVSKLHLRCVEILFLPI